MPAPGGAPWTGAGAEAAQMRAAADRVKVLNGADDLRSAANIARTAVEEIDFAKRQVLRAVGEAQAQGFLVGEDLGVTDRHASASIAARAARQAQAQALAVDIRTKAITLAAVDQQFASQIVSTVSTLASLAFDESPPIDRQDSTIQAVDFKQSPADEPDPGKADENPRYPDHKPNGQWAPGNSGIDGEFEAQKTFDEMEANGIPVVRDQIGVRVTDPETGHTFVRYYDGLRPTGRPGEYVGIEHKVNKSPITPNQQAVDDLVRSGIPAHGQLNGQPVTVTDVQVIRVERLPADGEVLPGGIPDKVVEAVPKGIEDWGTHISPRQMDDAGFPFNVMEDIREQLGPRNPNDPKNTA